MNTTSDSRNIQGVLFKMAEIIKVLVKERDRQHLDVGHSLVDLVDSLHEQITSPSWNNSPPKVDTTQWHLLQPGSERANAFRKGYPNFWSDQQLTSRYDKQFFNDSLTTLARLKTDFDNDLQTLPQPIKVKRFSIIGHYTHTKNPYAILPFFTSKGSITDNWLQQGVKPYFDFSKMKCIEGVHFNNQTLFFTANIKAFTSSNTSNTPQGDSPIVLYQTKNGIPDIDIIYSGFDAMYYIGKDHTYVYWDIVIEDLPAVNRYRQTIYGPSLVVNYNNTINNHPNSPFDKFSTTTLDSPFVTQSTDDYTIIDKIEQHYNDVLLKECTDEERVLFEKHPPIQNRHNRYSHLSPHIVFNSSTHKKS